MHTQPQNAKMHTYHKHAFTFLPGNEELSNDEAVCNELNLRRETKKHRQMKKITDRATPPPSGGHWLGLPADRETMPFPSNPVNTSVVSKSAHKIHAQATLNSEPESKSMVPQATSNLGRV